MCDFCDKDAIHKETFYSSLGQELSLAVCEEHYRQAQELDEQIHTLEFEDKIEEMAERLFGSY